MEGDRGCPNFWTWALRHYSCSKRDHFPKHWVSPEPWLSQAMAGPGDSRARAPVSVTCDLPQDDNNHSNNDCGGGALMTPASLPQTRTYAGPFVYAL